MTNLILVFPSNSVTMIATRTLRDSGCAAKIIPKPASVQSESNLCLSVDQLAGATALAALKGANISVAAIPA
jgi:hypothetical protein